MPNRNDVVNFAAGPSTLPTVVLEKAAQGLLNYNGLGMGVAEISHRSKEFKAVSEKTVSDFKTLMDVPDTHEVLLMQGGGMGAFSTVVLNLLAAWKLQNPESNAKTTLDYIVTGSWSNKAAGEAKRLTQGTDVSVNVALDARNHSQDGKSFSNIPPANEWKYSENPAFVYYCDNETVNGVEFDKSFPYDSLPPNTNLVADVSSNILSRKIDVSKHAVVYGGAQKNAGIAGLTLVIVRKDLLVDTDAAFNLGGIPQVPHLCDYKRHADNESMYNTPPMFAIYVSGLTFEHILNHGGVDEYSKRSDRKSSKLYQVIDNSNGLYKPKVSPESRSRMNVVFTLPDEETEKRYLNEADKLGLKNLKGHRSVGGIRASLYNGIAEEDADKLIEMMKSFK
ncbi:hypothetical protein E3P92_00709 [Wallemia ichthyophaga]|nr:hypothetical protein E3P92_00709 [Wallemia ichthyophaga]